MPLSAHKSRIAAAIGPASDAPAMLDRLSSAADKAVVDGWRTCRRIPGGVDILAGVNPTPAGMPLPR